MNTETKPTQNDQDENLKHEMAIAHIHTYGNNINPKAVPELLQSLKNILSNLDAMGLKVANRNQAEAAIKIATE